MELGDAYRDFISLLLSSSIGFLNFIYCIFHAWEFFFFFFFWICLVVLCSPFPWRVLFLYKYTAYNYFILYNSIIHEPYLSVSAGFICVSLYPFFFLHCVTHFPRNLTLRPRLKWSSSREDLYLLLPVTRELLGSATMWEPVHVQFSACSSVLQK